MSTVTTTARETFYSKEYPEQLIVWIHEFVLISGMMAEVDINGLKANNLEKRTVISAKSLIHYVI